MKQNKTIVILFSKLSDYMLNMFNTYVNETGNILVVFKKEPYKTEAPFNFNLKNSPVIFFNESQFDTVTLIDKVENLEPCLIICSGWSNTKYVDTVKYFKSKIDCILAMDNQWHGTLKQYFGILYSIFFIKPLFKKIWVPGLPQKQYAQKLGFKSKDIFQGWYVANFNNFLTSNLSKNKFNKRFVFVGRYIEIKGLKELVSAFINLKNECPNTWELHCIGTGYLENKLEYHKDIVHHGFLQPSELKKEANQGGVFCLPSHFEPWGLVVQEFALSGYPLIVSSKVGSASKFISVENGFIIEPNNINSIKKALIKIVLMTDHDLIKMSQKSKILGKKVNKSNWIDTLNQFIRK